MWNFRKVIGGDVGLAGVMLRPTDFRRVSTKVEPGPGKWEKGKEKEKERG